MLIVGFVQRDRLLPAEPDVYQIRIERLGLVAYCRLKVFWWRHFTRTA